MSGSMNERFRSKLEQSGIAEENYKAGKKRIIDFYKTKPNVDSIDDFSFHIFPLARAIRDIIIVLGRQGNLQLEAADEKPLHMGDGLFLASYYKNHIYIQYGLNRKPIQMKDKYYYSQLFYRDYSLCLITDNPVLNNDPNQNMLDASALDWRKSPVKSYYPLRDRNKDAIQGFIDLMCDASINFVGCTNLLESYPDYGLDSD